MTKLIRFYNEIGKDDGDMVGGKNANLGEMINKTKVPVPEFFAVTANAYRYFIHENQLQKKIDALLKEIKDPNDTKTLAMTGKQIRALIVKAKIPRKLKEEIQNAYIQLGRLTGKPEPYVAVRSSATAEDLPDASFAGQQETYLNVKGNSQVIQKVKECYASLYTDRAIFYRIQKGFEHSKVALSAAVQLMVNSKAAGVMFTLDVRNGKTDVVMLEGSWGLGELVVQGTVTPDDFFIDKKTLKIKEKHIGRKDKQLIRDLKKGNVIKKIPEKMQKAQVLNDKQVKQFAKYAIALEKHYKHPQDSEWAIDTDSNKLYITQTRPETVWSLKKKGKAAEEVKGKILLNGQPASPGVGSGVVKIVHSIKELSKINPGDILVASMTSPDMVPAMKKASAIITNEGGATSHAAIVSRELGIPCVVGTGIATKNLKDNQQVTVDGNRGNVLEGIITVAAAEKLVVPKGLKTKTKIYVNMGVPEIADTVAKKPCDGVGLMRMEFILAAYIKEHPLSLIEKGKEKEFINKLTNGIEIVAKAFYPREVILRFSDFKTNEYRKLKGGEKYEPEEENPMLGWRGCSRYYSGEYIEAFKLEIEAIKKARKKYKNIYVMLPFVRTLDEIKKVKKIMKDEGLERSKNLRLYMMAEIPSNIFLADKFAKEVDGFSIGSNDLTQLILGVDRDSETLAKLGLFNENNEAVRRAIAQLIKTAHANKVTVGICGQAPSNYPDFAMFLVDKGIDSISLNADAVEKVKLLVFEREKKKRK